MSLPESRFDAWLGRVIWSVFFCDFIVVPVALGAFGLWLGVDPGAADTVAGWLWITWEEG